MAEQERIQRKKQERGERILDKLPVVSDRTEHIDDLLDEIDTVLEENAEDFVKNYVQKGGQ
jgi:ubiquitin-like protein Pup